MAYFLIYKDSRAEWRWRLVSDDNGKIVAASSEGFSTHENVKKNISWVRANAPDARLKE